MIKFLDLKSQYLSIKEEIDTAIANVIGDTAFVGGKYVSNFESNFAKYLGVNHCIGVGNGTDALEIAIASLDLPKGSEIIVPANSFIASSEAITNMGYKVKFCDNDADNYTISVEDLMKQINSNVSAVIAVHLYGHPANIVQIAEICKDKGLKLIEDCAQAHGAEFNGKRVAQFGDVSCFSFYPGKNLGAYGDGGCIATNNDELADKARMITNHGSKKKYIHEFEGRNSRLDALQASILDVKLKYLDNWIDARNKVATQYNENLKDIAEITLPKNESWAKHVYHLFVIRVNDRDNLIEFLNKNDIQTGIHYPISLPKLPAYQYIKQDTSYMNAVKQDGELLSLPMGEHLTMAKVDYVCDKIKEYYRK